MRGRPIHSLLPALTLLTLAPLAACDVEPAEPEPDTLVRDKPEDLVMRAGPGGGGGGGLCLTDDHLMLFEDTQGVMADPAAGWSGRNALLGEAVNQLTSSYGDNFDFVTFFIEFEPYYNPGGAYFTVVHNDVQGIGLGNAIDRRAEFGLDSTRVQGFAVMNDRHLLGGNTNNDNTLAHEFGHRWLTYLPNLNDGRVLRNVNNYGHWNSCQVDTGGGALSSEWAGSPARLKSAEFNVHTGGRYSYVDLYLMGYVSAAEMDGSGAEHRYLDNNQSCNTRYTGTTSPLLAQNFVDSYGPRLPDAANAQQDFRTATIMIHLPGEAPPQSSVDTVLELMDTFGAEWPQNTLGRGTMDVQLFTDADCDGTPDP